MLTVGVRESQTELVLLSVFFPPLFLLFFTQKVKDFLLNDFNMPLQLCSLEFRLLLEEKLKQTVHTCVYRICLFSLQN